ncbi:MAG TPA: hypothetical protein VK176_12880 [Phycisphaerales bacterium]|nr:hypothetical protein [Phycisphaerales bacterium]
MQELQKPPMSLRLLWICNATASGVVCMFGGGFLSVRVVASWPRTVWTSESGEKPPEFMLVVFPKQDGTEILSEVGLQPVGTLDVASWAYVSMSLHPTARFRLGESTCVRHDDVRLYVEEPERSELLGEMAASCVFTPDASGGTVLRVSRQELGHFPSTKFFEYHVGVHGEFTPVSITERDGHAATMQAIAACGVWLIVGGCVGIAVHRILRRRWEREFVGGGV